MNATAKFVNYLRQHGSELGLDDLEQVLNGAKPNLSGDDGVAVLEELEFLLTDRLPKLKLWERDSSRAAELVLGILSHRGVLSGVTPQGLLIPSDKMGNLLSHNIQLAGRDGGHVVFMSDKPEYQSLRTGWFKEDTRLGQIGHGPFDLASLRTFLLTLV